MVGMTAQNRLPGFKNLVVWQKSIDLVEGVYRVTRSWPKDEVYGLTNQIRRAAISIPSNIAEGRGRTSAKEYLHHLSIAHGSLCEVETQLVIARRLKYLNEHIEQELDKQTTEIGRLLNGLIRSIQPSIREDSPDYSPDA